MFDPLMADFLSLHYAYSLVFILCSIYYYCLQMYVIYFQTELEKLNKASEEINKLELELDVCIYIYIILFLH